MNEIIAALQAEIEAAKRMRHDALRRWHEAEIVRLAGYIEGLETAVDLLTKAPAREITQPRYDETYLKNMAALDGGAPIPFTAENGDCSFMGNGDLR